jgi:hypothetical protein
MLRPAPREMFEEIEDFHCLLPRLAGRIELTCGVVGIAE